MRFFSNFLLFICLIQTCLFSNCKVLVIGCGRSGTTYTTTLLRECGYDIQHESFGEDGSVSWAMTVNQYSYISLEQVTDSFEHIFHQVRNPLNVITSWSSNFYDPNSHFHNRVWSYIYQYIPQINQNDPLITKCAKYWYYWNLLAEEKAEWRYRIEDIEEIFPEFCEKLGIPTNLEALQRVPKNTNTWSDTTNKVTWEELERELDPELYQNIREMATRYGY